MMSVYLPVSVSGCSLRFISISGFVFDASTVSAHRILSLVILTVPGLCVVMIFVSDDWFESVQSSLLYVFVLTQVFDVSARNSIW